MKEALIGCAVAGLVMAVAGGLAWRVWWLRQADRAACARIRPAQFRPGMEKSDQDLATKITAKREANEKAVRALRRELANPPKPKLHMVS